MRRSRALDTRECVGKPRTTLHRLNCPKSDELWEKTQIDTV